MFLAYRLQPPQRNSHVEKPEFLTSGRKEFPSERVNVHKNYPTREANNSKHFFFNSKMF